MYGVVQEWVFPFIKNLHGDKDSAYAKYLGDAIFKIPTPLMPDKMVKAMDDIYEQMARLRTGSAPTARAVRIHITAQMEYKAMSPGISSTPSWFC